MLGHSQLVSWMKILTLIGVLLSIGSTILPEQQAQAASSVTTVFIPAIANQTAEATESLEDQVIALTNQLRAAAGCDPLVFSEELEAAAIAHSSDMATQNFFSHYGPGESTPLSRVQSTGYAPIKMLAENIAAGVTTAEEVVDLWYNSPGHRTNMLNCQLKEIGVGTVSNENSTYTIYWTQVFGSR